MINEFVLLTPRFKEDIDSDHTETGLLTEATLILRRPSSFAVPSLLSSPVSYTLCEVVNKRYLKESRKKRRAGKVLSPGGYRPIYYRGYIVDKQIVILFIRMNEKKWLKKYCSNI